MSVTLSFVLTRFLAFPRQKFMANYIHLINQNIGRTHIHCIRQYTKNYLQLTLMNLGISIIS